MNPPLAIVAELARPAAQEPIALRIRRLQAEARQLAGDHIRALSAAIAQAQVLAQEIAEGGEAYPAGVRDLARRFAEDADGRVQSIDAIAQRAV